MPLPKLTKEQLKEALKVVDDHGGNVSKAAEALGIPRSTLSMRVNRAREAGAGAGFKEGVVNETGDMNKGKSITVNVRIKSLDAAISAAEVDLSEWEVERYVINKWEMAYKDEKTGAKTQDLWQVKLWLKKRKSNHVEDYLAGLEDKIGSWKPVVPNLSKVRSDRHLLEVSLFDAHFGKLAWGGETGTEYDLRIAKNLYQNAVEDLLERSNGFNIEQILFPIGNDFFHVNSWKNTTVNDTPQDVDTRMSKIFEVGCDAVVKAIERCLMVAPVNVLWVPGNHDPETSYYMAKIIDAWYRNVDEVRVNKEPTFRKYIGYGVNLLGFTHGNEEPHRDLPTLMSTERPDLWSSSSNRVWHLGHFHKKKETSYNVGDTYNGVRVQVLPSLSGTDAWHYKKGYVKGNRAAEAYLWSYKDGYAGHFNAPSRLSK